MLTPSEIREARAWCEVNQVMPLIRKCVEEAARAVKLCEMRRVRNQAVRTAKR